MNTSAIATPTSTTSNARPLVTGLFPDRDSAEAAYNAANSRGYSNDDVNLVMSDDTRSRHFTNSDVETELGNKAAEGAGIGGAIGGTLGAIAAAVAAVGTTLALPGLGFVIAGPIAAAVAGAAGGGLIGALIGWNMPEERVKEYEEGVKKGGILMGVHARSDEDADYLENQWREHRGERVYR